MILTVCLAGATCLALSLAVFLIPQKKIFGSPFSVYSIVPLIGAIAVVAVGCVSVGDVFEYFTANSAANPIKIIILFISMSLISVYLDETGFFEYVAYKAAVKTGGVQIKVFVVFYLTVSVLTVFTSNDIVILTFTPFICQFCRHAKISAVPYVFTQFVAANTWSLLLMIGNPTNVFLAQASGIDFFEYLSVMWLPCIFAGVTSFLVLLLTFFRKLKDKMELPTEKVELNEKTFTAVGLVYLLACTLCIAVLPYFGVEMFYVAAGFCVLLFATVVLLRASKKQKPTVIVKTLRRAPFEMIPLVLGMAVVALALYKNGVTDAVAAWIGEESVIAKYGVLSTLAANLFNNVPMSMIFANIAGGLTGVVGQKAVYSTVIGSNIGAYLTPLGALAGLMFTSILSRHGVKFSFKDFVKYGFIVAPLTLCAALVALGIVLG